MKIAIKVKFKGEADWQVVAKTASQSAKESVTNFQIFLWCSSCSRENGLVVFCYLDTKILPGTTEKKNSIGMDKSRKVVMHTIMVTKSMFMDNKGRQTF